MVNTDPYRWNTTAAAEGFDAAAPFIHPRYTEIQRLILERLPFKADETFSVVDLGGGSGRLVELVLHRFPRARAAIVDQSEAFLAIAERRLRPLRERAVLIQKRLQDEWAAELPSAPQAIVSMSAIHHLEPAEKQALYRRCHDVLAAGGVLLNGDEFRPESDLEYRAALERWGTHKEAAAAAGQIPASFQPIFERWYDRNIRHFGEPRRSGDDCHETLAAQERYLREAGFTHTEVVWQRDMWGLLLGWKQ